MKKLTEKKLQSKRGLIMSSDAEQDDVLKEYRKEVKRSADLNDGSLIMNDGRNHAAVLLQEGIDHTHSTFDLFSTSLKPTVYDDPAKGLIPRFVTFTDKENVRLRILLRKNNPIERNTDFIEKVFYRQVQDNVEIRILSSDISGDLVNSINDFFVSDSDNPKIASYRYETDMKKMEAIASFGYHEDNGDNIKTLSENFEFLWKMSEETVVPRRSNKTPSSEK